MENRREFLRNLLIGGGILYAAPASLSGMSTITSFFSGADGSSEGWDEVPRILARIKPPTFPNRDFDITKFGAVGDNKTDCTEAFRKAIAACSTAGGGRVVVPAGEFSTGAIHLKSNVNLHVASGGTIRFSRDPKKYLPLVFTRWEGIELMNYSPFIYAFEQENMAITGEGTIDGQSDCQHWWPWKGRKNCGWKEGDPEQTKARNALLDMAEKSTPVQERIFGEGYYLRPQFIQPYRCKNVLIEGVTLRNSPMWQVHPVLSTNVTVRKLTIISSGPNTDGCDPESCTDVLIKDCFFDTGDDCIAIKAGRNGDGRRLHTPSQNIVVQGCHMKDGHGGVTVGSEISGGVRNVFAENCQMDSPNLDFAIRIKNNAMRGGLLENIYVRDITVGQVSTAAITIDFYYEEGEAGKFTPVVRNVDIRNLKSQKAKHALYLRGFKQAPISNVVIENCDFGGVSEPNVLENVKDISLRNVRINGKIVS
jgi:polygalacturonase